MLAAAPARADVIIADGELDPSSFDVVEIKTNEGGRVVATTEPNGNPGRALRVQIILGPSLGPSGVTAVFLRKQAYDPMASGGFASIDYAEDYRLLQGGGEGQATGIALLQNGTIFVRRLGTTPERDWTRLSATGLTVDDFERLDGGQQVLNFSSGGQPIRFGFFRANAHPSTGGTEGSQVVGIDNWRVALVPACASDANCDDADLCTTDACVANVCRRTALVCTDHDACTVDACVGGACSNTPLDCDDGASCTADACVAGVCLHDLSADARSVRDRIGTFITILEREPCNSQTPRINVIRKLGKRLRKARAKLDAADAAVRLPRITRLLDRAQDQIVLAADVLGRAEGAGHVTAACAADLRAFLEDVRLCVAGVPRL